MSVDRLAELLDAAATVPQQYRMPPLAEIHGRVRRRRARLAVVASAVLVVALVGGVGIAWAAAVGPLRGLPGASPSRSLASVPADPTALPWGAALVARDDRTITVHAGPDGGCQEFASPRATVSVQDSGQVVIAVHARVVAAADCGVDGSVQLTVTLPSPLGTRAVRDGSTGAVRPLFHERYLPRLPADQWHPVPHVSWGGAAWDSWFSGYNGPGGTVIYFWASPTDPVTQLPVAGSVRLGTRDGVISGSEQALWQVVWHAGGASYCLEFEPREGTSMTLPEFRQLLTTLTWS